MQTVTLMKKTYLGFPEMGIYQNGWLISMGESQPKMDEMDDDWGTP